MEFAFDQYGVRVPAILISPWVDKGFDSRIYDHTSLLKYLIMKWNLRPDTLGARVAAADTFVSLLQRRQVPRPGTPGPFDIDVFASLEPNRRFPRPPTNIKTRSSRSLTFSNRRCPMPRNWRLSATDH